MASLRLTDQFVEALEMLDLKYEKSGNASLLLVSDIMRKGLSARQVFSLETAAKYKASAVYFRKFDDNRQPIAQIYIYDNTRNKIKNSDYAEIHRNIWSGGVVPLFIIIEKTQVLIFDSRKPVDTNFFDQIIADPIEILNITSIALKEYSSRFFDNGSFWEKDTNSNHFLDNTSAYYELIDGLKRIRTSFIEKSSLPVKIAHKLLVLSILIKYLEERGNDGETLFAKNFFKQFGADNFCGVLRKKGKIINLFAELASQFNGEIFTWDDPEEIELLRTCELSLLANFLDANIVNNQYVLWRRYSFAHLPVELISSIYEEFLAKEKSDVVYTPHFLVDTLIDECMPLDQPKEGFKIIDASCGSGIFLVAGYKRLVEWWRYKQYIDTNLLPPPPDLPTLKRILKSNVFGVDIEKDATSLTIFSLALALCDMLTPKQIWTELKFDDLSKKNIIYENFFSYLNTAEKRYFDLIIGNPPFIELTKLEFERLIQSNNLKPLCKIPQNQIALLFLEQAIQLLKKNALLCLIMPSGPLIYNDTMTFRKHFFSSYNINQILDFTNLSSTLFGKASVATSAIFVTNQQPDESDILHITVRRTKPAKEKIFFEIDHYDFHYVSKEAALTERYIWKANLFGGYRIFQLLSRLSKITSLEKFLLEKKQNENWDFGQGYIVGEKNKIHEANYITGFPTVIDKYFTEEGIGKTEIQEETLFKDKSKESIFSPPHLLIKKNIGAKYIPIIFSEKYLTFRNEVIGINAPPDAEYELKHIMQSFQNNNRTYRFFISTTSARSGVSRSISTLLYEDIMNLPYPENQANLKLSYSEKIIVDDVLNYTIDQVSKGANADVNNMAEKEHLLQFSTVYCKGLNSIYKVADKNFKLYSIINSTTFYGLQFQYTNKDIEGVKILQSKRSLEAITELVEKQTGKNLHINRFLKIYQKDKIYLIKPKQIRYWLKSIALRDADETLTDMLKAGY